MDMSHPIRLLPTMEVIGEAFSLAGHRCFCHDPEPHRIYRNVRLFTGQQELLPDVVYALRPGEANFPTDRFAYVCSTPIEGRANHLYCPDMEAEGLLDFLLEFYSQCQQMEMRIDQLAYGNASMQSLCALGEELLENPVCIHDDWFILIGISPQAGTIMKPEYHMSSSMGFLPRVILDDFQQDQEYLETYAYADARVWEARENAPASLYVNLLDDRIYRGRMVVIRHNRDFRKFDFILAQVLTQRAMLLLRRKAPDAGTLPRSMDDVVYGLLSGENLDAADLTQLLNMLRWARDDRFLCIRIRSQRPDSDAVMAHVLHSDLFRIFPRGYILFTGQEQCLILNLTQEGCSLGEIRSRLAPLCRDYCLYAGLSSPVPDIRDLRYAHHQAKVALDRAFRLRSERWMVHFSECAMEYVMEHLDPALSPMALVSPELLAIRAADREKGTQYFETLKAWLLQERDIPRTAQELIIHRTTLLYRLKKLKPMLGCDLEDPWQRLYLLLSLWILEREGRK